MLAWLTSASKPLQVAHACYFTLVMFLGSLPHQFACQGVVCPAHTQAGKARHARAQHDCWSFMPSTERPERPALLADLGPQPWSRCPKASKQASIYTSSADKDPLVSALHKAASSCSGVLQSSAAPTGGPFEPAARESAPSGHFGHPARLSTP